MARIFKRGRYFWIDYRVEGVRYRHSIRSLLDELAFREIKRLRRPFTTDELFKTRRAIEKVFENFIQRKIQKSRP